MNGGRGLSSGWNLHREEQRLVRRKFRASQSQGPIRRRCIRSRYLFRLQHRPHNALRRPLPHQRRTSQIRGRLLILRRLHLLRASPCLRQVVNLPVVWSADKSEHARPWNIVLSVALQLKSLLLERRHSCLRQASNESLRQECLRSIIIASVLQIGLPFSPSLSLLREHPLALPLATGWL